MVVRQRLVNQRLIPTPMEPRGAAADYDAVHRRVHGLDDLAGPHVMRLLMTAFVFGIPETKMRCISPQVGGGFGTKIFLYHEYVLVAALAREDRPAGQVDRDRGARTTRRRRTAATTSPTSRSGAKRDGTITALKAKTYANLGGILSTIAPGIPTTLYGRMLSGCLPDPGDPLPGARRLHEHGHGRRLPRRRPPRGDVRRRARRSTSSRASSASTRSTCGARTSSRPTRSRTTRRRSCCAASSTTPATTRSRSTARSRCVDYDGVPRRAGGGAAAGPLPRHRLLDATSRSAASRPSAWIGAVGEGWGAGLWESANVRVHLTGKVVVTTGSQAARPGARDDDRRRSSPTSSASRSRT